jgi:hypothetical protein
MGNMEFYNNVIASGGGVTVQRGSNNKVYNNIIYGSTVGMIASGDVTHGYNYYSGSSPGQCDMRNIDHENIIKQYPTNCDRIDPAGLVLDPFIDPANEDYRLKAPLSNWPGINLCTTQTVCDTDHPYNIDMYGNVRGADGVWDRGAYEYTSTGVTNDEPFDGAQGKLQTTKYELKNRALYPNPLRISDTDRLTDVPLYDLAGRPVRLAQTTPSGLYLAGSAANGFQKVTLIK